MEMLTNIMMNKRLLAEVRRVTEALREYIRIQRQKKFVKLFGTIEFGANYDYKTQRSRM
jgi:hypothetical protein